MCYTKESRIIRRRKYNRGDIDDTLLTAQAVAIKYETPRYVFATYSGYLIDHRPPSFGQNHYTVNIDGTIVYKHTRGA